MKTLILMRHAKSDWRTNLEDHKRPLNRRGRLASTLMAAYLCERGVRIDHVLCSPSARTRETFALISESPVLAPDPIVEYRDELYLASSNILHAAVRLLPEESNCVLVLAHQPGISAYASELAKRRLTFATASIALFEATSWTEFQPHGELREFASPKGLV